nr:U2 protein [Sophora yellow stunt virus]
MNSFQNFHQMKEEQDKFWDEYHQYLRRNEDMLGEFCKFHGRRVKAYPKMPVEAPCRWVLKKKTVYDIRVEDCKACLEEQVKDRKKKVSEAPGLQEHYDTGKYVVKVYY